MKVSFIDVKGKIINSFENMEHIPLKDDAVSLLLRETRAQEIAPVVSGDVKSRKFSLHTDEIFIYLDVILPS